MLCARVCEWIGPWREVAFIHPKEDFQEEIQTPWFALNRFLEVVFTLDIFMNFIRAYRNDDEVLIHNPRQIAKRYVQSWFGLDVVTTVPFDLIIGQLEGSGSAGSSNSTRALKLVRVVRLVRLLKLARLVKGLAIFRRVGVEFSLDYNMLEVFKFLFITLLYAHWMACVMGITTHMQDSEAGGTGGAFIPIHTTTLNKPQLDCFKPLTTNS